MNYEFWKKTGQIKPFKTVEEMEKYEEDLCKLPSLSSFANTALTKSKIKKGVNILSEKFDSFTEYAFVTYMRSVMHYVVERNMKQQFLNYVDQNGKLCKFYPDFVVNGVLSEVKGRLNAKDQCKLDQHPQVQWYFQDDVNKMMGEMDKLIPHWRADFIQTN